MKREAFTVAGKIRLTAVVILLLFSLVVVFPAPNYTFWELEIAATEGGYFAALLALALFLPGWNRNNLTLLSAGLALAAFTIFASPLVQAVQIASTLPGRLETAFASPKQRSLVNARRPQTPITLRSLVGAPRGPKVDMTTLSYASRPSGVLHLDLYRNSALRTPRPLVIVVHGGSWQGGSRGDLAGLNYFLAARGYAVGAVSYRFAPEFPYPASSEDLNAAVDYLKANSGALGLDASKIVLLGRSSGGHLALLSAYTKRDSAIRGVVAFYPPVDQLYGYRNPSRVIPSRTILENYLSGTPASNPQAYIASSPIDFVDSRTVPTLLIHGSKDELVFVQQSRMLDARLAAARRPHLLLELPWATHGCDFLFTGPCAQLSTYAIEGFLAAVMR